MHKAEHAPDAEAQIPTSKTEYGTVTIVKKNFKVLIYKRKEKIL